VVVIIEVVGVAVAVVPLRSAIVVVPEVEVDPTKSLPPQAHVQINGIRTRIKLATSADLIFLMAVLQAGQTLRVLPTDGLG
jgi:hypothetical protein